MRYDVWIFAGQSNMFGADAVIDGTDKTLDLVEKGIQTAADAAAKFALGSPFTYGPGDIRGHQGTSFGVNNVGGVPIMVHGPEVGFNRTLYAQGYASTFIIKYGANFTALESGKSPWVPGGSIWTAWQSFVDAQLAAITAAGNTYRIMGFCWCQGIDDALRSRTQADYMVDLRTIISAMRTKFGGMPWVMARSIDSQIAGSAAMAPIRQGQVAVAADSGNGWTDLDDLTPYVNTHHMSSASQLTNGQRMAAKYIALLPAQAPPSAGGSNTSRKVSGTLTTTPLYRKVGGVLAPFNFK
jgi:hypothetical protein